MAQKRPDEDLFADSTMTFGEHIEELRGALSRALVGLVLGVAIGFGFADDVLRWIESPLKDGLQTFYLHKAKVSNEDVLSPEQLYMISHQGLAPEQMQVEAAQFVGELRTALPDVFGAFEPDVYSVKNDDIIPKELPRFCQKLFKKHKPDTLGGTIWSMLDDSDKTAIEKVAGLSTVDDAQVSTISRALNKLIALPNLHQAADEKLIEKQFTLPAQAAAMKRLLENMPDSPSASDTRRVNRLLLSAYGVVCLKPPRPKMMTLTVWQSIDARVQTLGVEEGFLIWFKAAFLFGAILSSPWIFYQIWNFVAAGLYPMEKKYVHTFLPFSLTLFFAGAALAFFFVFPLVLKFLFSFNDRIGTDPYPRLKEWMSFALFLPIGFGISFQLPLVMLLLERIGIFTVAAYLQSWRMAVLIIAVLSMILTPSDPGSMLMMGIPLTGLYFGGIALCRWWPRPKSPLGAGYDP